MSNPIKYVIREVQLQGWNLEVGVCLPDGDIIYRGKSEHWMSLRWSERSKISIYDNSESLLVKGGQPRKNRLTIYELFQNDSKACTIHKKRIFTRELMFTFLDGSSCSFWRPVFGTMYKGESTNGWRYEVEAKVSVWNVSIWGLENDLALLSALMYCYRENRKADTQPTQFDDNRNKLVDAYKKRCA